MDKVYWQIGMTLADSEKRIIIDCLRFNQNNQSKTAQMLGVTPRTISNKLKEYGLEVGSPVVEETPAVTKSIPATPATPAPSKRK